MRPGAGAILLGATAALSCGQVPGSRVEANLTPFELAHGVGPVKERVQLGPLDEQLAAKGQKLYQFNCASCHRLDRRFVGPPLGAVTTRRSPEFVLNMILAPQAMLQKHPEARKLLEQYLTPMSPANVSPDEARAILEYLRGTSPPAP